MDFTKGKSTIVDVKDIKHANLCDGFPRVINLPMDEFLMYNKDAKIIGDLSDGDHSFSELYHHRALLFSIICKLISTIDDNICWKSKKHYDGSMYDGYFIVGVGGLGDPIFGDKYFSYHYSIDDWDSFRVKELRNAPEYTKENDINIDHLSEYINKVISNNGIDARKKLKDFPLSPLLK